MQWEQAREKHIVPLRLHKDSQSGREILVMPAYICALDTMPRASEAVVLRGTREIAGALQLFHQRGVSTTWT